MEVDPKSDKKRSKLNERQTRHDLIDREEKEGKICSLVSNG